MDDLAFAHELADLADSVTLPRFRAVDLRVDTKADLTVVSDADRAAEDAIRERVARARPGEGVLGEERGDDGTPVRWIVDPVDGTSNYVRGVPVWATLLALERDGRAELAMVSAPALGRRWWAVRGGGALADGQPIRVSGVTSVEKAYISVTSLRAVRRLGALDGWLALCERASVNRGLGDFWQYVLVAEGAVDVALDPVMNTWDYVPVQLIVEEAGGRCTDVAGGRPANGSSFLATNGALHDEIVGALSA